MRGAGESRNKNARWRELAGTLPGGSDRRITWAAKYPAEKDEVIIHAITNG